MSGRRIRRGLATIAVLAGIAIVPSQASAEVQTQTFDVGPLTVAGYEVQQSLLQAPHPNLDGYITRMEVDLVDSEGQPIPIRRLMLHHIVFLNLGRPDTTCSSLLGFDNQFAFPGRERFFAAGEERAKMVLPPGYGYKLKPTDPWTVLYMVMNHRRKLDEAFIRYTVTTVSGEDANSIERVDPYWFDANNCRADPIYNVPGTGGPDSTHNQAYDFTFPKAGRIVAGAGHVHGGARMLTLTEPGCGDREIARSEPTWGAAEHPFYNVKPILHEPGPINMTAFGTEAGIPVAAGETVRLNSLYENSLPHVRVMGIFITYVAEDAGVAEPCGALPTDVNTLGSAEPGRAGPIPFEIPLTGIGPNGKAREINRPPGKTERLRSGTTIGVRDRFFTQPNVRLRQGARLRWRFAGDELHNITLANGPVGIASPNMYNRQTFEATFDRTGTYRFFCGLHPVQMAERVVVRKRGK
jgi:hypothetical protein